MPGYRWSRPPRCSRSRPRLPTAIGPTPAPGCSVHCSTAASDHLDLRRSRPASSPGTQASHCSRDVHLREVVMNDHVDQARTIFLAAIEEAPDLRPAFLDGACGEDGELRAQVEHLLEAHQALGSIHFHPIPGPAANADSRPSEGPGSVIGPYKLIEAIGEGGMGTVYVAEQER